MFVKVCFVSVIVVLGWWLISYCYNKKRINHSEVCNLLKQEYDKFISTATICNTCVEFGYLQTYNAQLANQEKFLFKFFSENRDKLDEAITTLINNWADTDIKRLFTSTMNDVENTKQFERQYAADLYYHIQDYEYVNVILKYVSAGRKKMYKTELHVSLIDLISLRHGYDKSGFLHGKSTQKEAFKLYEEFRLELENCSMCGRHIEDYENLLVMRTRDNDDGFKFVCGDCFNKQMEVNKWQDDVDSI